MQPELANDEYKIGAVAKITGIGTETLRAWERRYRAVVPKRSDSGDRVYSEEDLSKLFVLKNLVDAGNSIGTVAHLSLSELKSKWDHYITHGGGSGISKTLLNNGESEVQQRCKVVLLGEDFPLRVLDGLEDFADIEVVGHVNSWEQWKQEYSGVAVHVVVVEMPTINESTRNFVAKLLKETGAWHVVILYGFGSQRDISKLQSPQVSVIRSSIDVYELARVCIDRAGGDSKSLETSKSATIYDEESIPTRRFSNKQLESLARIESSIQCECPRHLSDLIKSLVAFEIYSAECENKNADDAAMHSYLHATTAQSRAILEDALAHIISYENITI